MDKSDAHVHRYLGIALGGTVRAYAFSTGAGKPNNPFVITGSLLITGRGGAELHLSGQQALRHRLRLKIGY